MPWLADHRELEPKSQVQAVEDAPPYIFRQLRKRSVLYGHWSQWSPNRNDLWLRFIMAPSIIRKLSVTSRQAQYAVTITYHSGPTTVDCHLFRSPWPLSIEASSQVDLLVTSCQDVRYVVSAGWIVQWQRHVIGWQCMLSSGSMSSYRTMRVPWESMSCYSVCTWSGQDVQIKCSQY